MFRALELAKNGIGITRPNPSVGAVIVHNNRIIGEGFTSAYGGFHAEVNAINAVKNKELLKNSSIYVTLEPCAHYGKTPPCSDLIISYGIRNVFIGCQDDNPLVAGKGIERLRKAGCIVHTGILEKECQNHHKRFLTFQNKKRPYIFLKWAETLNGFIAPKSKNETKPVWISNEYSRQFTHKMRANEHAILVGTNTVIADNPSLNVRDWGGNNPVRIILDKNLRISKNHEIYSEKQITIIITATPQTSTNKLIFEQIDFSKNVAQQICEVLYRHNIQSLIVEGGATTLQTFIDQNLWDEAYIFKSDVVFENGIKSPDFKTIKKQELTIANDKLSIYKND